MKVFFSHISFLLLLLMSLQLFSQTKAELEKQRNRYKKEINQLNKLLFSEQKKEKNALEELQDLNQKIELRNKLLTTIVSESNLLSKKIDKNENRLQRLKTNLATLKENYIFQVRKVHHLGKG